MQQKKLLGLPSFFWKFLVVILVGLIFFILFFRNFFSFLFPQPTLAQCLTAKGAIMYGADSCSHCQDQKNILGKDFENIRYINCEFDFQLCKERGITTYPIWSLGNKILLGTQTKAELASFADCPIIP